ncbi:MAG: DUF3616 domain-containing protein [Hydrococcus sp. C42_A2020_068]|nr:DUF3616 domain-containing protein [Hydrococcus sp. C42_A2020_068]
MIPTKLIEQVKLDFNNVNPSKSIHQDLSTAVFTSPDTLWVASDEINAIERLKKVDGKTFGEHQSFHLSQLLNNFNDEEKEVDIEGMDYDGNYLWLIGSHSTKRKKAKLDNINRLQTIKQDKNRYLLARIPLVGDKLEKEANNRQAAYLERNPFGTNQLIEVLKNDPYIGDILSINLPGKDNGFDIEGLLVREETILIGLRGLVLRGIAIILEISVEEKEAGILSLKSINNEGQRYKKHFLDLDGLGVRDLCLDGEDVLILAGPTMDLDGTLRVFRWQGAFGLPDKSFSVQKEGTLATLFDIPYTSGSDRAEGLTLFPHANAAKAVLVVYDSPDSKRIIEPAGVLADVFAWE